MPEVPNESAMFQPATRHYYRPLGFGVERGEEGGWELNFLITPMEVIVVEITDEDKAALVRDLTGGIEVAKVVL